MDWMVEEQWCTQKTVTVTNKEQDSDIAAR